MSAKGAMGFHTLYADRVEIIETDGTMAIVEFGEFLEIPEPVKLLDGPIIAIGLLAKEKQVQRLRAVVPGISWPTEKELTDLAESVELPEGASTRQIVKSDTVTSLQRIRAFLDQPDLQTTLNNWPPEDDGLKPLMVFLAQLNTLSLMIQGKRIEGIDLLATIFKHDD